MSVDKMPVDKMPVDKMSVYEMTFVLFSINSGERTKCLSTKYLLTKWMLTKVDKMSVDKMSADETAFSLCSPLVPEKERNEWCKIKELLRSLIISGCDLGPRKWPTAIKSTMYNFTMAKCK